MSKKALLIIDSQVFPFDSQPPMYRGEDTLALINALAHEARASGALVVFIQHVGPIGSPMELNSAGWQLHPALIRKSQDLVIGKQGNDSFYETNLINVLQENNVTELFFAGYATEFCVDTSFRSAVFHGYKCNLVKGAHTTKDRPILNAERVIAHHEWVLQNLTCPGNPTAVIDASEIKWLDSDR